MTVPKKYCQNCNGKMTYDPLLSKKKSKTQKKAFWCVKCDYILVEEHFIVKDKVQSVRNYLFHEKLPQT
jgi:hypothetical protein